MKHGFKTWAEKEAERLRRLNQLAPDDALPARSVAQHLNVRVVTPEQLGISAVDISVLLRADRSHWSAMTLYYLNEPFVVHNPSHSEARQETDLMHELAHLLCEHPLCRIVPAGKFPFPMREYNAEHEAEADWLAGALKVPREAMLRLIRQGASTEELASHFECSLPLARMRRNKTGVDVQVRRSMAYAK